MISKPSKSAKKREYLALQALGEQLIALSPEQLGSIGLDERLHDAVSAAKSMRAHGALRRQKQLIGKLMRSIDPDPIRTALERFGRSDREDKQLFSEAEKWRDKVAGGDAGALDAFFDFLGHSSDPVIREVRSLQTAAGDRDVKAAKRRIFREIHKEIARKVQKEAGSI